MNGDHPNAVAGPSGLRQSATAHPTPGTHTTTSASTMAAPSSSVATATQYNTSPTVSGSSSSFLSLFLPPPAPPPPKQHLASTQDLLARLQLLPAYDKYVRPLVVPGEGVGSNLNGELSATVDKGKGREVAGGDVEMADAQDADDDDALGGKGEKKKKNSYKHLIKGVPGKHSFKKDDYLATMMLVPPKQRMRIHRFDEKTQEDAFTVSLEGLKGWNYNTLVVESAQAREDRKKRKEAKRAAKLQAQTGQLPLGTAPSIPSAGTSTPIAQPQPIQAPLPTSASSISTHARRLSSSQSGGGNAATPKPSAGTPRPGSRTASTVNNNPGGGGGAGAAVPRPTSTVPRPASTVPRPGSAVPRPGSAMSKPSMQAQGQGQLRQPPIKPMDVTMDQQQRGIKREREENTPLTNGVHPPTVNGSGGGYLNGNGNGNGVLNGSLPPKPPAVVNAKAGTGNIRPRPIKKQRMDVQGQSRDVTAPVQQPTPQGV